ncbi:MAG: class I SAM-dependent methyltransferase [Acidimicrobiales bacterium]
MDRHAWDERYAAAEQTFVRDPNRLVVQEVAGLPPGTALDLATGEGRHAVWLASVGWHVVAVDFAEVGLRRAQQRSRDEALANHIAFALADVYRLRLPPGRFDLVLGAFFHPRPPERAALYAAIAAALAPGGSAVFVSYDLANLTEGTGSPKDPELLLQPDVIRADLEALGLAVTRADTVRLRTPTSEGQEVDVVDAVIRAVRPA